MCGCDTLDRRSIILGLGAACIAPNVVLAEDQTIKIIGGGVAVNTPSNTTASQKNRRFQLKSNQQGGVIQAKDQLFYLDPDTEADFFSEDDGLVSNIVLKAGGVLSLFGPSSGQGVEIKTFNAVGAIRGTTTYFAWQKDQRRTYVCCCYGGVQLTNALGGQEDLQTKYHTAVILPENGGVETAPYDTPLNHYDDDIVALESKLGRRPRWQLPNGQLNFFAPNPVPL